MLFEFNVIPVNAEVSMSDEIAKVLEIVDRSGLRYKLTPAGTCVEGEWGEVMDLIHRCHQRIREDTSHVVLFIKVEDEAGADNKLVTNITSVEEKVGKKLERV
jgi:uncharacterized protein (TIGR00106 family)